MLQPFTISFLLSVLPILRVKSESLLADCSRPNEALLQIEIKYNRFPHDTTTSISMVLSDLSSGAQDTIVPEGSIASTIYYDTATTIVSKDICLPANHCLILAIYHESTRSGGGGACCGYQQDEGWYYNVTFDGITIKEGNGEFQSSDYLQFGGGCQMPSKDKSVNERRHSLFRSRASADDTSTENSYVEVDEEGRRYSQDGEIFLN